MNGSGLKNMALIAIVVIVLTAFIAHEAEAAGSVGKITRATGSVQLNRKGRILRARVGTRVMVGDLVQTKTRARVKILMSDSSVLSLGPNSKMRIRSYSHNRKTRRIAANYDLVYGRGRAKVPRRRGSKRNVKFRTPSAVAGVRGTELIIEYDPATGQTRVIAVGGTVTVINPDVPGEEVTLTAGMGTLIGSGAGPTTPFGVPMSEIMKLRQEAHVPGSSPRKVQVIQLPGTGEGDFTISVTMTDEGPVIEIILDDSGTVINPEDLIDQEPPPFTPVTIELKIKGGPIP